MLSARSLMGCSVLSPNSKKTRSFNLNCLNCLRIALESIDPTQVETALDLAFQQGLTPDLVPTLNAMLTLHWHQRHEDIARALQILKDPLSLSALTIAARQKYDYLAYNNSQALARKCIWAIADIGTANAQATLQDLAKDNDPIIAGYAERRLSQWEQELTRKGHSQT
jgi:hypothetical protein